MYDTVIQLKQNMQEDSKKHETSEVAKLYVSCEVICPSDIRIGNLVTDEFYENFKTIIKVDFIDSRGINLEIEDDAGNVQQYVVSGSLPTDEDISKKAQEARVEDINDSINRVGGFIVGATWMRDLLKGNYR